MQIGDLKIEGNRNVLIAGPTASGKSGLAISIANDIGGVVVNADALQIYDCWRLLSARPSREEETLAPHALYGHVPFDQPYSVADWLKDITDLLERETRLVIVGGTGLYFRALTNGLVDIPDIPADVQSDANGRDLNDLISDLDDATKSKIDLNNPRRVQRVWAVWKATGVGMAQWHDQTPPPLMPLETVDALVLQSEPEWLNQRIARRFNEMIDQGVVDEVSRMLPHWDPSLQSSQAIGAPELIGHLQGQYSLETATERAIIASRQYAKRQRTWARSHMKTWAKVSSEHLAQDRQN